MASAFSISYLAPLILLAAAGFAFRSPGRRPGILTKISQYAALGAFTTIALGGLQLAIAGSTTLVLASGGFSIAFRADLVSITMAGLVSFIGWTVLRFSRTYLDGEANEGAFHALMLSALAAIMVFVQSGSLLVLIIPSMLVGISIRKLLLFYPERPEAQRAATKFSIVWHLADGLLVLGTVLLFAAYGTGNLSELAAFTTTSGLSLSAHFAIAFIVIAAALKTASFPVHGWLTEVMEAPTPVSALLHAGIINSGGVLLISTANIVSHSPGAMAALVMIGGLTALFGAAVMLTQSAVKTALAWSTVSQMGFMLLQCGLGLWALALLHILAHSLYKAHAFLSSGGAVKAVASVRRPGPVAVPNLGAVLKSFGLAIILYVVIAIAFVSVFGPKSAQALALGAILVFGVAYLVAQGLADMAPKALTIRTAVAAFFATVAYFGFQAIADLVWAPMLPETPTPEPLEWAMIVLAAASFGLVAFAQALFPLWAHHPATVGLRVHLANGLYLNALLDRTIGGFRTNKTN